MRPTRFCSLTAAAAANSAAVVKARLAALSCRNLRRFIAPVLIRTVEESKAACLGVDSLLIRWHFDSEPEAFQSCTQSTKIQGPEHDKLGIASKSVVYSKACGNEALVSCQPF